MKESKELTTEEKRDQMLVDALLRISVLENLLIESKIASKEKIAQEYINSVDTLKKAMISKLGEDKVVK
jgi:hypothetical protein